MALVGPNQQERKTVCVKYTTTRPVIQGVRAKPNEVSNTEHIAPKPKPKRKRATPASALEKVPKQPSPTLCSLNEKLEGLSDIVK